MKEFDAHEVGTVKSQCFFFDALGVINCFISISLSDGVLSLVLCTSITVGNRHASLKSYSTFQLPVIYLLSLYFCIHQMKLLNMLIQILSDETCQKSFLVFGVSLNVYPFHGRIVCQLGAILSFVYFNLYFLVCLVFWCYYFIFLVKHTTHVCSIWTTTPCIHY